MRQVIVNNVCPLYEEYSQAVQVAEKGFSANRYDADIEDTLEVACPFEPDCNLRFELYIKEKNEIRTVRNGTIGNVCIRSTIRQQG